jgi:hypothetical protein
VSNQNTEIALYQTNTPVSLVSSGRSVTQGAKLPKIIAFSRFFKTKWTNFRGPQKNLKYTSIQTKRCYSNATWTAFFFARVKGHTDYCGVYNTKAGPDCSEPAFVKNKRLPFIGQPLSCKMGGDLLSRFYAVPSARQGLTSLFGMGRGGSPAL